MDQIINHLFQRGKENSINLNVKIYFPYFMDNRSNLFTNAVSGEIGDSILNIYTSGNEKMLV